ncbi:Em GEA1 (EM1) [bacterium (Candidatus Howlettbacteria) CG_4_10_14_3_um_filter_37_10]|nr:MAG: Em GEA1 (EM1) [bacterium (Candidatus Howlettbacteria) CG23_combo_of_CG06-09_8_20_14_all_37_9]PIX99091.1 MAG: Em GEA1 (EM1) [bacterium (Candidatus Howlettbacteria) CG_4_10_14_3_um_filter_37_10]
MAKEKSEEKMTVEEAGKRGGQATSKKYGREFYEKIGHKGGPKGGQRVRDLIEKGKEAEEQNIEEW